MKKLIALLLVICMVAGLFIGCKKKTKDPATDPTASVATEATDAVDPTEGTEASDATDETGVTEETETPEETEQSANKKPTAASKVTKATKATAATKATKATAATKATQSAATKATAATQNASAAKSPYRGKTIQIYGMGTDESYQDMQTMIDLESTKTYPYIERAAIAEWAELNGVTIEWKGSYDQNTVLSAINAGEKPDVIFQSNNFPGIATNGIVASFTNAEYKKLASICGEEYLDLMKWGNKSYGVLRPWVGTMMCYYNVDMFNEYGVKTPKEYFLEGNWNWDTFYEVMQKMTKDADGDGTIDTYGLPGDSFGQLSPGATKVNSKGQLESLIDEPYVKDYITLKYECYTVKQCIVSGANRIQSNVIKPMFAMQLSDCEPYNWQHLYQEIPNGQRLEVAPVPEWKGDNGETLGVSRLTQSCFHMAASCDEREAVIDLMTYILKCGLKYVSDYSLGTVDCEYEGLQGSCAYSKKVVDALAKINATRAKKLKAIGDIYDAEYVTKLNEYISKRGHMISWPNSGVPGLFGYDEITQMPPESSIPAVKTKFENALNAYNKLYLS